MARKNDGASQDTRTIVTVLLLLFAWPAGLITMWVWSKWSSTIQFLITSFFVLTLAAVFIVAIVILNAASTGSNTPAPLLKDALIKTCSTCLDAHGGDAASCQTECRSFLTPTTDPYQQ